jgi:cytochrome c-type biogenesis protein
MSSGLSTVAIATSFAAGIVSFLSPCVLPLVPAYVSFIGGRVLDGNHEDARAR